MIKKLSRILGIAGGALALLPILYFMGQCVYTLLLPDVGLHFESKGYAYGFLILNIIPCVVAIVGLVGGLIVRKKPVLGSVLMIVSGALLPCVAPLSWMLIPGPVLLVAAGILALIAKESSSHQPPSHP